MLFRVIRKPIDMFGDKLSQIQQSDFLKLFRKRLRHHGRRIKGKPFQADWDSGGFNVDFVFWKWFSSILPEDHYGGAV